MRLGQKRGSRDGFEPRPLRYTESAVIRRDGGFFLALVRLYRTRIGVARSTGTAVTLF